MISLCQDILVRPGATQHHADTTLERLRGNHYIQRGDRSEGIAVCAAVAAQEKKGTSQSQFMVRAQSALVSALTHALGLTIHKPASNYCPLKYIVHVSYIIIIHLILVIIIAICIYCCTSTIPLPQ